MLTSLILSAIMLTDSLSAVTVTADKGMTVSRSDTIKVVAGATVSEVLMHNPGLHVMDNGGAAGLKTVSLRGMGSAHTSIYIDGVRVGNVQSGQPDLGMIGLGNCESISVDYAQSSVNFKTARPVFSRLPVAAHVRFTAGSFGTYEPGARIDFRLSDKVSLSADFAGNWSRGDFRYADDAVRVNNDIRQIRSGLDLWGLIDRGDYHVKAYYNDTDRGVPGSVYYPSEDRQKDRNAFVQGYLRKRFSQVYALQVSAKVSYDDLSYISTWGDSSYGQTETQLNSSHEFNVAEWCRLSLAADLQWDAIKSDQYDEERLTLITAAAAMFRVKGFTSKLTLEYNGVADTGKRSIHLFSPAFDMKLMICDGLDLTGYVRRANRVPVFNELYYPGYGNPDLNTEKAWLADLGVDYRRSFAPHWSLRVMADLFYNSLRDKIISAPSADDPNIWRPYNIGKVLSHGSDISAGVKCACRFIFSAEVKYSYVNAVDRTPESPDYGKRLPYVAGHSLMCSADASLRGWRAGVIWQLRDGRYDSYGSLPKWNTLDVTVGKSFDTGNAGTVTMKLAARNILNERYELSSGYPMPGASVTAGLEYRF